MRDTSYRTATQVSREEIFQAIGYAALKARAGHLAPGTVIKIRSFELVVAEDEAGDGIVVQTIVPRKQMEAMVMARAEELGPGEQDWKEQEKADWLASFFTELRDVLKKWQSIEMHHGPGENLTFEKAVYK